MVMIPEYVLLLFHLLLLLCIVAAQRKEPANFISLGSKLSPRNPQISWPSSSGHFAFGFYPQNNGFAVGIWLVSQPENIVVWTANRNDPPVSKNATLVLTKVGISLLRNNQSKQMLITDLSDHVGSALMDDSGNFMLFGHKKSAVLWGTFDFPTDTLLGGQNLTSYSNLTSSISKSDHSSGRFQLEIQTDNGVVASPVDCYANEGSYSVFDYALEEDAILRLDHTGHLYIINGSSKINLANSHRTPGPGDENVVIYRATFDADGFFRLYAHHFENSTTSTMSTEWIGPKVQCDVKGFCGFNSYCSSTGTKGDCYCFPGYISTNQSGNLLSCSPNFTEDCREDHKIHYNMTSVENTWWADYPYSEEPIAKEVCSRSCKEDCHCGAALYASENCQKFKLPLRYGRRDVNFSSTAFLKVFIGSYDRQSNLTTQAEIVVGGKEGLIMTLAVSLGSIAFFCFVVAVSSFFIHWRQVHSYRKLKEKGNLGLSEEFSVQSFSYGELEKATNNFNEELGKGSFGAVYRGSLNGGSKAIAVKRLEKVAEEGEREFRAEISAIGRTYHRNLVQLLGFCVEGSKKLLVYEYMKNGSLADILFKARVRPIWRERVRIALDVARGIFYLHEECEFHIVHCNIKPRNILIDDSWTAKISDFGLAKLLTPRQTSITPAVAETREYSAPEWQRNTLVSVKADIYSFGIVLLEIICCRSNIELDMAATDQIMLFSWVYNCFMAGEVHKLVEDEDVDMKTLERMVKVGLWCIQDDPTLRPPMNDVILMLEGLMEVQVPPSPALSIVI